MAPTTLTITNADQGKTFHVKVGSTVIVALTAGSGMQPWNIQAPPVAMLAPAGGSPPNYRAAAPGTASISASDRPVCAPGRACPQFIQAFKATVIVDA